MPRVLYSDDLVYQAVAQDDGNFVVYVSSEMVPGTAAGRVWDRWSHERSSGSTPPPAPHPPRPATGTPRLVQITDDRDPPVEPRQYSYYAAAYCRGDSVFVFVGHTDGVVRFYEFHRGSGEVTRLGERVPYGGTAEGWYWDRAGFVYLTVGSRLRRVNPFGAEDYIVYDVNDFRGGCDVWQAHSSDDGRFHSMTVRQIVPDGEYPKLGTMLVRMSGGSKWGDGGGHTYTYYSAEGVLDESQITSDGRYLLIKESHGDSDDDNRVINVNTGDQQRLTKADGALGHSDCGNSLAVGADRANGTCALIDFRSPLRAGRPLFHSWDIGHIALRGDICLQSDATHINRVSLAGAGLTPLIAHGMVGSDYDHQVMANIDPSGQVACFISNRAGRFDVYVLEL